MKGFKKKIKEGRRWYLKIIVSEKTFKKRVCFNDKCFAIGEIARILQAS